MSQTGTRIKYGNFAPGAKEDFTAQSNQALFDTLSQLQKINFFVPNYANPCESFQTTLDGNAGALPDDENKIRLGFISRQISESDGKFAEPISIELEASAKYSSQGIAIVSDTYNNIYPTHLSISWYSDDVLLYSQEYFPDSAQYTCKQNADYYNKIIITFYSINMPSNRLKISAIEHGFGTWFEAENLRNVKIIQEIDPISATLSINTADLILDVGSGQNLMFQEKQPLSIYFNGQLISTAFVRNFKRKTQNLWSIKAEDYVGLLDGIPFYGGIYVNKNAADLIYEISDLAKITILVESRLTDIALTGYLPYTSCREALKQIVFAMGAVADTSYGEYIRVFSLADTIQQTVSLDRIMQGQSFDDEETITGVALVAHTYKATNETLEAYNANESGISENGKEIFVKFNEPLYDVQIIGNGEFATDKNGNQLYGTNYAVIYAYDTSCILSGKKYEHSTIIKRKNNPNITAGTVEKIVAIERATLISQYNVDNILEKCYNYLVKTKTINARIVEGKHYKNGAYEYDPTTKVGDRVAVATQYLGTLSGIITKQTYNLNGGIIIKDSVIR